MTRNQDFEGKILINKNIAYENGINGIVIHKTTHPNATISVQQNKVFKNGRTKKDKELRQDAGGLTINSGHSDIISKQTIKNNIVVSDIANDISYQCFGSCELTNWSTNNQYCGNAPNSRFANVNEQTWTQSCDTLSEQEMQTIMGQYPASGMPDAPQYTPFQ